MTDLLPALFVLVALAIYALIYIGSLSWLYHDVKDRGGPALVIVLLVAFFAWPLGLLIWWIFRPKKTSRRRVHHAWDGSILCRACRRRVSDLAVCPACGAALTEN